MSRMNKESLHQEALKISSEYRRVEFLLVDVLRRADEAKLWRDHGKSSLFIYATELLGLSEAVAYSFIRVARKLKEVPQLAQVLSSRKLSVSKACRLASTLNRQNAKELIEFASKHTSREIDFEVARRNPKAGVGDKVKPRSEDQVQVTITISKSCYEKMERAKNLGAPLERVLDFYLERRDPVRKAERAATETSLSSSKGRKPNAAEQHAVHRRDQGRCTHTDQHGRCRNERWTQIHHIRYVSHGGDNSPENLTTLCAFHHRLTHGFAKSADYAHQTS